MGQSTAPRPIERITFCGGGALRLLGVVDEILRLGALAPHPQLVFMDTDVARAETMAALRDVGYEGCLVIECRTLSGPADEVLPRSVEYVRSACP